MSYSQPIVPAIIPQSVEDVRAACERLGFSLELHLDVVDGQFVPFTSWPYLPAGEPQEIKSYTDQFTLEVDLMVARPLLVATQWIEAGADMLVFHAETIDVQAFRNFKESVKITIGISANNDTPDQILYEYLPYADYVQVMGITHIGTQGQAFDERALDRIAKIKNDWPKIAISIDGSVNEKTIARLAEAKVHRFIVGSAMVASEKDAALAHFSLQSLIN